MFFKEKMQKQVGRDSNLDKEEVDFRKSTYCSLLVLRPAENTLILF